MATSASGAGGGAAVPASRVKADRRVTRTSFLALYLTRLPAGLWMKANPTRTNPTSSPVWFAPIKRPAAGGGPARAGGVAGGPLAAGRRMVSPDRVWANSGPHRHPDQPTRVAGS